VGIRDCKVGDEFLYLLARDGNSRRVVLVKWVSEGVLAVRVEVEFVQMGTDM